MCPFAVAGKQSSRDNSIKLESIDRIINLPIVESGWNYAGHVYDRLKVLVLTVFNVYLF